MRESPTEKRGMLKLSELANGRRKRKKEERKNIIEFFIVSVSRKLRMLKPAMHNALLIQLYCNRFDFV